MEYAPVAEARTKSGLRLALTVGGPAPYGMSARAILDWHQVPYLPVVQQAGSANEELVAWTGHRNAPIAVYNDEAPRTGWLEILNLAERLGRGPSLVPADIADRMQMVGLINEVIGERGLIWNLRLVIFGLGGPERAAREYARNPMYKQYGFDAADLAAAPDRARAVIAVLVDQVRRQRDAGSRYLIGNSLSALDVYWAYFSQLLVPLPPEQCPMSDGMRAAYSGSGAAVDGGDPILIEQRNWIFAEHLELPLTF